MKIPKKLKIGGHEVGVLFEELEGHADASHILNEIRIDPSLAQSHQEASLFHEILHYLNPTMDDTQMGHALLDSLAEQLYQVLKDNDLLK